MKFKTFLTTQIWGKSTKNCFHAKVKRTATAKVIKIQLYGQFILVIIVMIITMIIVMIPQLTRPNINEDNFDPATIGLESSPSIVRYQLYCHHHPYNYQYQHHHLIIVFLFFAWFVPFHFRPWCYFSGLSSPTILSQCLIWPTSQTSRPVIMRWICVCVFVFLCIGGFVFDLTMLMISVKIKIMTKMMKRVMSMMMIYIESGKK